MSDTAYHHALQNLHPAPPLFNAPQGQVTTSESQFWSTVRTLVARALQSITCTWVSWAPGKTNHDNLVALSHGRSVLCVVLAHDMLRGHNLEPDEVCEQILFVAEAFGLITRRTGPGYPFTPYSDEPSMTECGHVASLALEGQFPDAATDKWYTLLGGRCPRCAIHPLSRRPAQSRTGNRQRICPACGHDEAMLWPHTPPAEQWPVQITHPLPHNWQAQLHTENCPR